MHSFKLIQHFNHLFKSDTDCWPSGQYKVIQKKSLLTCDARESWRAGAGGEEPALPAGRHTTMAVWAGIN
jgi:hypothetical protein